MTRPTPRKDEPRSAVELIDEALKDLGPLAVFGDDMVLISSEAAAYVFAAERKMQAALEQLLDDGK